MKKKIYIFLLLIACLINACVFSGDDPVKPTEGFRVSKPNPNNEASGIALVTTLNWESVDGNKFDVYFGTNNPPTTKVATDISEKKYDLAGLQYGTIYYWKVVSKTGTGEELSGPVWTFTTKPGSNPGNGQGFILKDYEISTERPNYVNLLFQIVDVNGAGVTNLTTSDFELFENGEVISPFESQMVITKRDQNQNFIQRTVLLLDNSTSLSLSDLDEIKNAANNFVNNLTANHEVAVYFFSQNPELKVDFTDNKALLNAAINSLSPGFPTTNLYGAIIEGASKWEDTFSLDKTVKGSMIVFTDGRDTQASHSLESARDATQNKVVYTVGLGVDVDPEVMEILGTSGFISVSEVSELTKVFSDINDAIITTSNSFYWLRYSSPKRGNNNHLLQLRITGNPFNSIIEREFNSGGFYSAPPGLYINPSKDRPEGITFVSIVQGTEIVLRAFLVGFSTAPVYVWEEVSDPNELITIEPIDGSNNSEVRIKTVSKVGQAVLRVRDTANNLTSNDLTIDLK